MLWLGTYLVSRAPRKAPLATNRNSAAGHASDLTRRCFTASAATSAVGLKPARPEHHEEVNGKLSGTGYLNGHSAT